MRPHPDRIHLVFPLVFDPVMDHIRSKDIAFEQEVVVPLQLVERLIQRARGRADVLVFLGRQVINVLIERIAGANFVLNPLSGLFQHGDGGHGWD